MENVSLLVTPAHASVVIVTFISSGGWPL